jgi:hypothetical protein
LSAHSLSCRCVQASRKDTADHCRNGTTPLFAALELRSGKVIAKRYPRHRARESRAFLRNIEAHVACDGASGKQVRLTLENYANHKSATVMQWLVRRPHWHGHLTPTHASWLNQAERPFALITNNAIRRGNFQSEQKLTTAIHDYLDAHNSEPKPSVWTATSDRTLEKVPHFCKSIV